ncbi:hypothetical protein GCM10022214_43650 [Actinomadura miaoliensis]|uniref:Uncharacterized protein n=1 Tax=Actinomadura miaoliensis TaxID=430685 RepID=A0ABP7W3Q7_9ACTN
MGDGLADVHAVEVLRRPQPQYGVALQGGVQEPVAEAVLEHLGRSQGGHRLRVGAEARRQPVGRFRHGGRGRVRVPHQP